MNYTLAKRSILILIILCCSLYLIQCGSNDDVIIQGDEACLLSYLTAGNYSFEVDSVLDGCTGGLFPIPIEPVVIELPGFEELPTDRTIELPIFGNVNVQISVQGELVRIVTNPDPYVGTVEEFEITASVVGLMCPTSPDTVNLELTVRITEISPAVLPVPCTVVVQMTGAI